MIALLLRSFLIVSDLKSFMSRNLQGLNYLMIAQPSCLHSIQLRLKQCCCCFSEMIFNLSLHYVGIDARVDNG